MPNFTRNFLRSITCENAHTSPTAPLTGAFGLVGGAEVCSDILFLIKYFYFLFWDNSKSSLYRCILSLQGTYNTQRSRFAHRRLYTNCVDHKRTAANKREHAKLTIRCSYRWGTTALTVPRVLTERPLLFER